MTNNTKGDPDPANPHSSIATLHEYAPHPYQSMNSDGMILTVNDAWLDTLGYERDEVEGQWFGKFLANDSLEVFESRFPELKSTGEVSNVEYEMECADGETIVVSYDGTIEYDDDGSVIRTHCQFQEITELKRREQELERMNDLFEQAQEIADLGAWETDLRNNEGWWTEQVNHIYGLPPDYEPDPGEGIEYFHPEDQPLIRDAFERAKEEGEPYDLELRVVNDEGPLKWVRVRAQPKLEDGEVVWVRGTLLDVTASKKRERELVEEREKYSTLVERSHDAIVVIQDGKIKFVNPQTAHILGYEKSELVGKSIFDIVAPQDRDRLIERYRRRLDPESESPSSQYDAHFLTKNGEERVANVSAALIQYEDEPADLVALRDQTERRRYEKELEHANEQLRVLNRIVRHDIRNDLSVVSGWAEELENALADERTKMASRIAEASQHVIELTKTVRDFIEAISEETQSELEPIALDTILGKELTKSKDLYPSANIEVTGEIHSVNVQANQLLSSVFRNILNNAVQHNDTDGPVVTVEVVERTETVRVNIADNGPGVPDAQRDAIFGRAEEGLDHPAAGIGLYLVDTLVSEYGGDVWVEENEPEGAVFVVELQKAAAEG